MWKITKDMICEGSYVGRTSRGFDEKRFRKAKTVPFRLLDDDGHPYLEGKIEERDVNGCEEQAFAPLDAFMYDLGVTRMEYADPAKPGVWQALN